LNPEPHNLGVSWFQSFEYTRYVIIFENFCIPYWAHSRWVSARAKGSVTPFVLYHGILIKISKAKV